MHIMKQKSITFRCSQPQHSRLESALETLSADSRSAFISSALEEFLALVEQEEVADMDLFALVDMVDSTGSGKSFAAHA